ncbi:MAG: phospholipase D-like domain-containing protein [bacterium]|nr:phospholipase D-like domain-containing protein [bacterium]
MLKYYMSFHPKIVSQQPLTIYKLLCKDKILSSKRIAEKLNIFPHAVYRAIKTLINYGLVKAYDTYPITYEINSQKDALQNYLNLVRNVFQSTFYCCENKKIDYSMVNISFIQNRDELLEKSNNDIDKSIRECCFIVSGLEVPSETVLQYKMAVDRGVKIRIIAQQIPSKENEMFQNWKKMHIDVRFHPLLEARFIIIDSCIVYMTSYNENIPKNANGIRLNYPPIAQIIQDVFEKRWKESKSV